MRWTVEQMDIFKWHTWFAWYPVELGDTTWVWMERVERKYSCGWGSGSYDYRTIQ